MKENIDKEEETKDNVFLVTYELDGIRYQVEESGISQEEVESRVGERVSSCYPGHVVSIFK